ALRADAFAPGAHRRLLHRLTGEVEIEEAGHVHRSLVYKQSEGRADARIWIEQLVQAVAAVVTVVNIERATVSQGLHESDGEVFHHRVPLAHPEAGGPAVLRVLPQLPPGAGGDTLGLVVDV